MLNGVYGGLNEKAPQVSLIWMLGSQLAVWEDEEELVETAFGISRLGPQKSSVLSQLPACSSGCELWAAALSNLFCLLQAAIPTLLLCGENSYLDP